MEGEYTPPSINQGVVVLKKVEHNSRELFYRSPFGAVTTGTEVTLRLSAANVGIPLSIHLVLVTDDDTSYHTMSYIMSIGTYCVYEVKVKMPSKAGLVWYYFKIHTEDGYIYYGNNEQNLGGIGCMYSGEPSKSFQITVYNSYYKTPEWFKKGVAYQIFPDRFYNDSEDGRFLGGRQDIIKHKWDDTPCYTAEQFGGNYLCNDFYGGTLKGIQKKLPYLKDLGISVLYLNPIFKAYSNHRYDTGDYMMIDPVLGTERDFTELCEAAEKAGIRIILDGVFNHTGSNSKYFNKNGEYPSLGAYQSKDSEYYSWFNFMHYPDIYESWWGMLTLPQVNEKSESYQKYILTDKDSVVKHWIKRGASGWRLDVVDELPGFFVKMLRKAVKEQNPDAVIIGEVWEDASNKCSYGERREYFLGNELDSVMNYPLRNALLDAVRCYINAEQFDERIMSIKENYPRPAFYSLLNILSTHDVERAITMVSGAPDKNSLSRDEQAAYRIPEEQMLAAREKMKLVSALQMTLPGVPCVYYGDEIGMQGYGDPFCRGPYNWDGGDEELRSWFKQLIKLRNSESALVEGELECVYKINNIYGFIRYNEDDRFVVLANFGSAFENIRLDVARYDVGAMHSVLGNEVRQSDDGIYLVDMPGYWIKIFKAERNCPVLR
jgi:4-alpha-glucanotransferase